VLSRETKQYAFLCSHARPGGRSDQMQQMQAAAVASASVWCQRQCHRGEWFRERAGYTSASQRQQRLRNCALLF